MRKYIALAMQDGTVYAASATDATGTKLVLPMEGSPPIFRNLADDAYEGEIEPRVRLTHD